MIILPTQRCERISLKNVIELGNHVLSVNESGPVRRNDACRPRGGGLSLESLRGPWQWRGVRRISKRTKIKNDPRAHARERGNGRRKRKDFFSFSLFLLSALSNVCCVPARCPSDCPSSLFNLTAFYPGRMINGFTEAPRYLPLRSSSDSTLRSFRSTRLFPTHVHRWIFCFSSRQIIARPLAQHNCMTVVHAVSIPSVSH